MSRTNKKNNNLTNVKESQSATLEERSQVGEAERVSCITVTEIKQEHDEVIITDSDEEEDTIVKTLRRTATSGSAGVRSGMCKINSVGTAVVPTSCLEMPGVLPLPGNLIKTQKDELICLMTTHPHLKKENQRLLTEKTGREQYVKELEKSLKKSKDELASLRVALAELEGKRSANKKSRTSSEYDTTAALTTMNEEVKKILQQVGVDPKSTSPTVEVKLARVEQRKMEIIKEETAKAYEQFARDARALGEDFSKICAKWEKHNGKTEKDMKRTSAMLEKVKKDHDAKKRARTNAGAAFLENLNLVAVPGLQNATSAQMTSSPATISSNNNNKPLTILRNAAKNNIQVCVQPSANDGNPEGSGQCTPSDTQAPNPSKGRICWARTVRY